MAPTLTLTDEFQDALDHLHAGDHLFLTGRAGTGKSTLIRHFLETTERSAITVAPTGIAALNVDGYTIHRLFSFPLGVSEELVRGGGYYPGRFATALAELDTLIVDEASMVRADLFDALTAALERFGPKPGTPFGGVQLVLVGDLYQLPPVVTDAEAGFIEERFGTPFFFSARSFDRDTFPVVELSTVFRQQGDDRLVDLLNAVREGALLEDARYELNRRTDPEFDPPLEEFWLTLATTNRIVGARNRQQLERLPDPARSFTATIRGQTDGFEHPTDDSLRLAVGAQVMLLTNDPADRWVNGTLGRITALTEDTAKADGPLVTIQLRDGRTVEVPEHTWDITRPAVQGGSLVHEVVGTFTQLPMKLAWAITIHKSQGQTLDRVVVDLTGGTFANGQLYVALSRCTSLEGLVLKRDVLPRDLKSDTRVRRFLAAHAAPAGELGEVYLAALTVGNDGDRYRARPVEIAVVTDEGDEATTVINPTSDLFTARTDFGITTRDVQLAPLLAEAWRALSPLLAGRVPIGVRIDQQLAWIDFELKRNGIVEQMPLGIELPTTTLSPAERTGLRAASALERARTVATAVQHLRSQEMMPDSAGTAFPQLLRGRGYLLARSTGDAGTDSPDGFVVGGNLTAEDDAAQALAAELETAWQRVLHPDKTVVDRLRAVEHHFGISVLPTDFVLEQQSTLDEVLVPGARVCFTGEVVSPTHGAVGRERMETLAQEHGLRAVATVTKTKTDVLVVAERGTQSNKTKNAVKWGKPVIAAEDFLEWVAQA
ncbi:AAA family ATPase [Brachybacterium avium]|uniref:AAA family ATPase n=1 Tax=Brachybacterium avium TaxID=2017485 RepID=A0A220UD50_9MICO|nr:AAA family ATPase [Brachybacterium avium]ASK66128.1 AAA family ATPase [Brachybacterium avium]